MLRTLEEEGSVFADLYKNPYPTEDQAYAKWNDIRRKYEEAQYAERKNAEKQLRLMRNSIRAMP